MKTFIAQIFFLSVAAGYDCSPGDAACQAGDGEDSALLSLRASVKRLEAAKNKAEAEFQNEDVPKPENAGESLLQQDPDVMEEGDISAAGEGQVEQEDELMAEEEQDKEEAQAAKNKAEAEFQNEDVPKPENAGESLLQEDPKESKEDIADKLKSGLKGQADKLKSEGEKLKSQMQKQLNEAKGIKDKLFKDFGFGGLQKGEDSALNAGGADKPAMIEVGGSQPPMNACADISGDYEICTPPNNGASSESQKRIWMVGTKLTWKEGCTWEGGRGMTYTVNGDPAVFPAHSTVNLTVDNGIHRDGGTVVGIPGNYSFFWNIEGWDVLYSKACGRRRYGYPNYP